MGLFCINKGVVLSVSEYPYKRILLKISGESLSGEASSTHDIEAHGIYAVDVVRNLASQIASLTHHGVQVGIVIGGGNILRGSQVTSELSIDRSTADTMGMLATVMNALALQSVVESFGVRCRVLSGIHMQSVAEPFIKRRAVRHLEKGRVVIFAGGTGNPFFTTDTAAALRALEIQADVMLKATNVDGIYCSDPKKNQHAIFYDRLTYQQAIDQNLQVMDGTAFTLLRDFNMPLLVFSIHRENALHHVLKGDGSFTRIQS